MGLDEMAQQAYFEFMDAKAYAVTKKEQDEASERLERITKYKEHLSLYISKEIQDELNFAYDSCHEYHGYPAAEFSYCGVAFKIIQWNNAVKIKCNQRCIDDNVDYVDILKVLLINFGEIKYKLSEYTVKVIIEYPVVAFDKLSALNLAVNELEKLGHKVNYDDTFDI